MRIQRLLESWEKYANKAYTAKELRIKLPIYDAARIMALAELYPGRTEAQITAELIGVALDELVASFPYVKGSEVIAEDDHGDPIYKDVGLTPRFHELTKKYMLELKSCLKTD